MSVRQCCGRRVLRHAFLLSQPLTLQAARLLQLCAQDLVWQLWLFVSVCNCRHLKSTDAGKLLLLSLLILQQKHSFLRIFFCIVYQSFQAGAAAHSQKLTLQEQIKCIKNQPRTQQSTLERCANLQMQHLYIWIYFQILQLILQLCQNVIVCS